MSQDRIEKTIELHAPVPRVWRALTDHRQFGAWFRVDLPEPFTAGEISSGRFTWPGYENILWEATVQKIEPEHYFSFTWHPYAVDPAVDYSHEPPTLVEFKLVPTPTGTLLTVTESGFENLPRERLADAFRMNNEGWSQQLTNVQDYVAQNA